MALASGRVSDVPDDALEVLDALAAALEGERGALLERDVPGLMRASQAKLDALRALESDPPDGQGERLAQLLAANHVNGALLAQRRRDLGRTLRTLRQHDAAPGYDAHGRGYSWQNRRSLAVA